MRDEIRRFIARICKSAAAGRRTRGKSARRGVRCGLEALDDRMMLSAAHPVGAAHKPTQLMVASRVPGAIAGATMNPIVIKVTDSLSKLISDDASTVTISLLQHGTLLGTTMVQAVNGVATFTGLSITTAGFCTLVATDGALKACDTNSFVIQPDVASATMQVENLTASNPNVHFPLGFTISVTDQFGNGLSGNVTLTLTSTNTPLTVHMTSPLRHGLATFVPYWSGQPGDYSYHFVDTGLPPAAQVLDAAFGLGGGVVTPMARAR